MITRRNLGVASAAVALVAAKPSVSHAAPQRMLDFSPWLIEVVEPPSIDLTPAAGRAAWALVLPALHDQQAVWSPLKMTLLREDEAMRLVTEQLLRQMATYPTLTEGFMASLPNIVSISLAETNHKFATSLPFSGGRVEIDGAFIGAVEYRDTEIAVTLIYDLCKLV